MGMKVFFLLVLMIIPGVNAIDVSVEIEEKIDGHLAWLNISSFSPQKFSLTWENLGSFHCISRSRVSFFDESRRVYTAWSPEVIMKTGNAVTWDIYSYLDPGDYNYSVSVYHCNEKYDFGPYPLIVRDIIPIENILDIVNSQSDENGVEISVSSSRNLENVIVIPSDYPGTWIFESGRIGSIRAGEVKTVRLGYEPINWEDEVIDIVATTEDGSYAARRPVILRKREASFDSLIFIAVMVVAVLIYLYFKKTSFLIWKK